MLMIMHWAPLQGASPAFSKEGQGSSEVLHVFANLSVPVLNILLQFYHCLLCSCFHFYLATIGSLNLNWPTRTFMLKLNLEKKKATVCLCLSWLLTQFFFLDYQKACSKPFSRGLLQNWLHWSCCYNFCLLQLQIAVKGKQLSSIFTISFLILIYTTGACQYSCKRKQDTKTSEYVLSSFAKCTSWTARFPSSEAQVTMLA